MLKTPTQIAVEKITELLAARSLPVSHAERIVAENEKILSVENGELFLKGKPIERALRDYRLFHDVPLPAVNKTQREADADAANGIHWGDRLRIVSDPLDQLAPDGKPAASVRERAIMLVRAELKSRNLPNDRDAAQSFLNIHFAKNLNIAPDGSLRAGFRNLSAEITTRPHEWIADFTTPKIKMTMPQFLDAQRRAVQMDYSNVEIIQEKA